MEQRQKRVRGGRGHGAGCPRVGHRGVRRSHRGAGGRPSALVLRGHETETEQKGEYGSISINSIT
ncbi:UNVERIFIED_CONTAM: hypothetical protein NCL1_31006 [Trichonephila clavipes]